MTLHVYSVEDGPDVRFRVVAEVAKRVFRERVVEAFEAWYNAEDSDDGEELYSVFVDALLAYAGVEFK